MMCCGLPNVLDDTLMYIIAIVIVTDALIGAKEIIALMYILVWHVMTTLRF